MKKRILALFLSLALVLCCIPNVVHAEEEATDYIEIRTAKDLYKVRSDLTANYKLMNDIDLTEATAPGGIYDYDGHGWNPIGSNNAYSDTPFTGIFDGQGHTIKGLSIRLTKYDNDSYYYIGLFANNEGTIKNLKIDHFNVDFDSSCKGIRVGTVAAVNNGTIQSVFANDLYYDIKRDYSYGEAEGVHTSNYNFVGGIAGLNNANILDSSVDGTILRKTESARYDIKYVVLLNTYLYISGIACNNSPASEIKRCSASIRLEWSNKTVARGNESGGGCFAGISYSKTDGGTIEDSYSNFESPSGGIYGSITNNGNMKNCYTTGINVVQSTGTAENCYYIIGNGKGGTGWVGLNDNQMQDPDSFEGFDFENTWRMSEETVYKYPQLRSIRNGVTKVEIVSEPTNEIVVGTDLKYEGAVARIYREDGTTEDVELTPENTEGGDTNTVGKKTVTYTYKGASASFEIDVVPVKITELEIKSLPTKTEYVTGQAFSSDGLVINAKYNNGTVTKCNDYYLDSDELDITTVGEKTLTASYNGVKVSFNVTYIAKQITDLKLTQAPDKTTYDEGQAFDPAGMVITAYYNDDTSVVVTDYTVGEMSGYGDIELPISYGGLTVNVKVKIRKLVKSVTLDQSTLELFEGQSAKLTAIVDPEDADNNELVWVSADKTIVSVDSDGNVTALKAGKISVWAYVKENINIEGICMVTVKAVEPETLEFKSLPNKLVYLEGEEFDPEGLSVDVINNDNSRVENVEFTVSKPDTTPGKKTVMVFAGGISSSFEIEYIEKKVTEIRIEKAPTKTEYLEGEEFDPTGLEVVAVCEGGFEIEVTDYTITGFNGIGQLSLSIGYAGKSAQLSVTVYGITGIEVTHKPDKLVYYEGEAFDKTGLVVKKVYANGYSEEIKDYTIGNMTGGGTVAIAVNYKNYKTSFNVTVKVLGGMKELMNALQSGNVSSGNLQITKDTNRVLFTYTKNGAEGYYISSQILKWYLYTDGTKSRQEYQIVTHDKDGNAVTRTFNASVDIKSYYGGTMINYADSKSVAITERYGIEINKLGSLLSAEAVKAWNDYIYDKYYVSLEKCGFETFFKKSGTIGKDATETAEVNKLVAYLKNHDNMIAIQIDNGRYSIEYKPESNQLKYHMYYMNEEGTQFVSEMSFTYDISSQNHDVELQYYWWKDKLISYKAYVNIALVQFEEAEHIPFISTGNAYPASTNKAYVEYAVQQRALSGDLLAPIVFIGFKIILAEKCNVDITKCGINSSTSYFKVGWVTENGKKYYYYEGVKQTGFRTISGKKYYFGSDGAMATGMQTIGGKKYYFGSDGAMKTGIQTIGGKQYYFGSDGVMKTGLQTVGGKTYYFGGDGKVPNGWKKVGSKWYYFKAGVMQTGWQKINKKWYYFKAGVMVSGWQKLGGKWYFFKSDGSMAANEWCKGYWLNKNGSWTYKKKATWKKDKTGWWFGCTGWYAKNQWQKIDGKWYYFDKKGYIVTGSRKIGSKTYKFNASGACLNP